MIVLTFEIQMVEKGGKKGLSAIASVDKRAAEKQEQVAANVLSAGVQASLELMMEANKRGEVMAVNADMADLIRKRMAKIGLDFDASAVGKNLGAS